MDQVAITGFFIGKRNQEHMGESFGFPLGADVGSMLETHNAGDLGGKPLERIHHFGNLGGGSRFLELVHDNMTQNPRRFRGTHQVDSTIGTKNKSQSDGGPHRPGKPGEIHGKRLSFDYSPNHQLRRILGP